MRRSLNFSSLRSMPVLARTLALGLVLQQGVVLSMTSADMALITRKPSMYKMYCRAIQKATTAETITTVCLAHLTLLIVMR